ncbi:MAG: carbohydrate binding domain-containing protein, partial [Oscillospiraceae bacterium]|nr:carbohydrate binding domain-containing protein [Oscillospiraceae bacterium]
MSSAAGVAHITNTNPAVTTCAPADNLITASDCESFTSSSNVSGFWRFSNFNTTGYGSLYTGEDAHSGTKAIKIPGGSSAPNGPSDLVPIQNDTEYTFSIWYKIIDTGEANFGYTYRFYEGTDYNAARVETPMEYYTKDGEWHQISMSFNSGTAQTFAYRYWFSDPAGSYALFDDAYLFETPAPVPTTTTTAAPEIPASIIEYSAETPTCDEEYNLIDNGNAEGATVGSFMSTSPSYEYWGELTSDVFHGGSKSFVLNTQRWSEWSGTYIQPEVALEPNKEYVFSFWYKVVTSETVGEFTFKYAFDNGGTGPDFHDQQEVTIDGQWHMEAVTFNSNKAT